MYVRVLLWVYMHGSSLYVYVSMYKCICMQRVYMYVRVFLGEYAWIKLYVYASMYRCVCMQRVYMYVRVFIGVYAWIKFICIREYV